MLALSFDYGQRHYKELYAARDIAQHFHVEHKAVNLLGVGDLFRNSGSSLVNSTIDVPEGHYTDASMKATIVPNRNAIMLSIAFGVAITRDAEVVGAAMHAGDHAIYPDCRPEFASAFDTMEDLAQGLDSNVHLWTPFIRLSKTEIVKEGARLGVPYELTWSCYKGGEMHCGKCGTCVERMEAFSDANIQDPTTYEIHRATA